VLNSFQFAISERTAVVTLAVVGTVALILAFARPNFRHLAKRLTGNEKLTEFTRVISQYRNKKSMLLINLLLACIEQLAPVLAFATMCWAFAIEISFLEAFAIVPLSTLLARLPISFAGLGVREMGLIYMSGFFGVTYAEAATASFSEFVLYLFSLLPGGIWFLAEKRTTESRNPECRRV
jgi:uncharacterized membrane protein YbhN (UPF0104 family)